MAENSDGDIFYLYIYRLSWGRKHDRKSEMSMEGFKKLIPILIQDPDICEIVVTDTGDSCLFNYKDGVILYPKQSPDGKFI